MKKIIHTHIFDIPSVLHEFMNKESSMQNDNYDSIETVSLTDHGNYWEGIYHYRLHPSFYSWIQYLIPSEVFQQIMWIQNRSLLYPEKQTMNVLLETIDSPYFQLEFSVDIPDQNHLILTIHKCKISFHNLPIPSFILNGVRKHTLNQIESEIQQVIEYCNQRGLSHTNP